MSQSLLETLISEEVNSFLAIHSGFANLVAIEDDPDETRVILEFYGGCASCPLRFSSTLKHIENLLKEKAGNENIRVINVETL